MPDSWEERTDAPPPMPIAPPVLPTLGAEPRGFRHDLIWEMLAVLCIGVCPLLIDAIGSLFQTEDMGPRPFRLRMISLILRSLYVSVPVLFLMYRPGARPGRFGIVWPRWWHVPADLGIAVAVVAVLYGIGLAIWHVAWFTGLSPIFESTAGIAEFAGPSGPLDIGLLITGQLANGFCEELVVRAYLITRLVQLGRSRTTAVLISASLFAAYHVYQGTYAITVIFIDGLLLGVVFLWIRRLSTVALAHAANNFLAYG